MDNTRKWQLPLSGMAIVEANYTYAGRFITHLAHTQMCFFFSFFPKTSGSVSEASAPE